MAKVQSGIFAFGIISDPDQKAATISNIITAIFGCIFHLLSIFKYIILIYILSSSNLDSKN
ncbi:hypothetical protein A3C05_04860 [Candidatus Giovannonibacteria bacterium RIFCSPHIGHO2_02_FULL_45_40]|uniref:Uncharacterized protein n=1 Tax=Candidatus Giovannonibacteria bacterium RIFCSPHIGHO2_02_FULL_45_40 TaxID=1798337 RepID=A0A1F5WBQ0_9BACT|nr:MAG: hypothetical protein A3C05_04860 [Candidatus Giovannonibacteria bacterium RIFCSPHIGHO2_02_FULL_45_40]